MLPSNVEDKKDGSRFDQTNTLWSIQNVTFYFSYNSRQKSTDFYNFWH